VRWALPAGLVVLAVLILLATHKIEADADSPFPIARALPFSSGLATLERSGAGVRSDALPENVPIEFPLSPGQTIGGVLAELELEAPDVIAITEELSEFIDLRRLKPDDSYAVVYAPGSNRITGFDLTLAGRGRVRVARAEDGWSGNWSVFERWSELRVVRGELEGALEASIAHAGGDPRVAFLMSEVFQWDLDFNRDLRLGDRFEVLYEQVFIDGSYSTLGEILAVRYTNLGKAIEGYRFGAPAGYYAPDGRPLRKMFLRSPMSYSRITSRYSSRRFHPVLKTYRPHYGVDYGAPVGTPVRVTSNGVVSFAGWDGGGGRTVKVRHPNGYLTAYLHLSKFASGISPGRRVSQGDTIGYVGSTGLATGPHLDYRVQQQGKWIDPLSLKSVPADPVPVESLALYTAWRDAYRESLDSGSPTAALIALRDEQARVVEEPLELAAAQPPPVPRSGS
jgi:murein DD-endopeptidase MepM/ murein hydrolase activator NlpD